MPERARRALRRRDPAPRGGAERADRAEPGLGGAPHAPPLERRRGLPGGAQPRSAAAHPAAGRARRPRTRPPSCTWSTAARTRPPIPTWRSARSCARGSTGCARSCRRHRSSTATPRGSTPPRPSATASARCRRRWRTRCGRSPRTTPRALDGAAALRRLRRRQARRARRGRGAGRRARCAGAMQPSTEPERAQCSDQRPRAAGALLEASSASSRARSSCATGCTRSPSSRTPRRRPRRPSRRSCRLRARRSPGPGRIARVGPADGAAVAVRAELDGLPMQERTGAPFSATGGTMHACGHDVHMAALVALTRAAHALGEELPAPLLAVFQPSEEAYPSGAEQLARDELAALAPAAVVAAHVHPSCRGARVALDSGTVNASCDAVEITVEGEPRTGPTRTAGATRSWRSRRSSSRSTRRCGRRIDPLAPAVLTVGVLEGGSAENVIPARARARAALRAHRPEDRLRAAELVEEVVAGIAAAHGCRGERRADGGRAGARERPRDRRARARAARRRGPAHAPASGARAARTTSRSSARSRRSRWPSSGSTAPRASARGRCTTPSCCRPTAPWARSRASGGPLPRRSRHRVRLFFGDRPRG